MCKVMSAPRRQQLRQRDHSKRWMPPPPRQVLRPQLQSLQLSQIFRPHASEFIQQLAERFPLALAFLCQAIEWLKRAALPEFQNHFRSRDPVGALTVYQMAHDIKCAPTVSSFITHTPRFGQ